MARVAVDIGESAQRV